MMEADIGNGGGGAAGAVPSVLLQGRPIFSGEVVKIYFSLPGTFR
jgi:hypothetical protein